ncbi:MAG: Asp23/Gls24 family envelope stress response protein [Erysipelotrichaceae bacterium]|nr:Asp23/Gls24 family envelope stress response protein [Erysipelotrichaceae bacterium]
MAQEYITLKPENPMGTVKVNKSVFSSIALNTILEAEGVKLVEGNRRPFKSGILTSIENNELKMTIPVKIDYSANVADVCANLQNKIFESISYMTDFKPENIEIQVVGFNF